MPRRRATDQIAPPDTNDRVSTALSLLLTLHRAPTTGWLADATATAAEGVVGATYALVYFEEQDGRLERHRPASDLRRRAEERLLDAFGPGLRGKLDPTRAPLIGQALDALSIVCAPPAEALAGVVSEDDASAGGAEAGVAFVSIAPLAHAGERLGALLLFHGERPDERHVRLFADHVALAAVALRPAVEAREAGTADITRSIFDERKLERELQRELSRAERYTRDLSLVIIEATNLRLLRERFGRFLADRLFERLGGTLAQNARDIDIIGSYKGRGYAMVLTEAASAGAEVALARLLSVARETKLDERVPGLELHLVAGWANASIDGTTSEALFAAAERRMYEAAAEVA